MTVAIWGATGATGSELLRQCLDDERVHEVRVFVRRDLEVEDEKLHTHKIEDFLDVVGYQGVLNGVDVAFWCLGVSQSEVSDEGRYREITCDYTLVAARALLAASPQAAFHFVSGMGAGDSGWTKPMWARVKGEAEEALQSIGFRRLVIWRPGYIKVIGGRNNPTGFERLWEVFSPLYRLVPNLVNRTTEIARAMRCEAFDDGDRSGFDLRLAKDILRTGRE